MKQRRFAKPTIFFSIALLILAVLFGVGLFLGSELLSINQVWEGLLSNKKSGLTYIIQEIRLPRLISAIISGAALALSGLLMQTYFRNALAGPYILGVSAGAGLGVAVYTMLGGLLGFGFSDLGFGMTFSAIVGAFSLLFSVSILSKYIGSGSMLLIVGLMLGSFASAAIGVLQYFSSSESIKKYLLWTFGSLSAVNTSDLWIIIPIVLVLVGVSMILVNSLNALLLGDTEAQSLGINTKRDKLFLILISGTLAGLITVYCGPIAFVGLAAPHIARMLLKTVNHTVLIPASVLIGAILLLFSDIVAQLPGFDIQLPINAVTSLIGAPLVIYIILQNRTVSYE